MAASRVVDWGGGRYVLEGMAVLTQTALRHGTDQSATPIEQDGGNC